MKKQSFSALDPFGQALLAYWRGNKSAQLIHEYKTGRIVSIPVSVFFRSVKDFYPTENALAYCRGRILVVGAGTGVHALELERQGYEVTAIEVNSQAVQIMKERGVKDIRPCDFFEFSGELYDTILMLGHNIGICETVSRIKILLQKCKSLLSYGGQLLMNSVDESVSPEAINHKGYPGELEFRLSHEGNIGTWMCWLHVDLDTLSSKAFECGWSTEKLIGTAEGGFLARLNSI
jgi:2-polyprenyl-3-methyl-5-hydroxy-6-metoxy-1,4-benzoquinol methylase